MLLLCHTTSTSIEEVSIPLCAWLHNTHSCHAHNCITVRLSHSEVDLTLILLCIACVSHYGISIRGSEAERQWG